MAPLAYPECGTTIVGTAVSKIFYSFLNVHPRLLFIIGGGSQSHSHNIRLGNIAISSRSPGSGVALPLITARLSGTGIQECSISGSTYCAPSKANWRDGDALWRCWTPAWGPYTQTQDIESRIQQRYSRSRKNRQSVSITLFSWTTTLQLQWYLYFFTQSTCWPKPTIAERITTQLFVMDLPQAGTS